MNASKLADPFVGTAAVNERKAAATPVATTGAGKAQAFDLAAAKKRLAFLEQRLWDLEGASKKAVAEQAALLKELDARQAKLAAGQITVDVVTCVSSELREIQEAGRHLQLAIDAVKTEHAALKQHIKAEQHRVECARQEKAAGPLKAEREKAIAAFITGLVGLLGPLQESEALREQIARDFPLASPATPLTFDDLAGRALQAWGEAGRFIERSQSIWEHAAFVRHLQGIVRGPFAGAGEGEALLRKLSGR